MGDQSREKKKPQFFVLGGNHLGNVLEVISDRKLAIESTTTSGELDYYVADVVSQSDYFPFGMQLPNRNDAGENDYRYSFQGQEKDNEIKGEGNSYDFGARIYDSRIGRWCSIDPASSNYPNIAPYVFVGNMTTISAEADGAYFYIVTQSTNEEGNTVQQIVKVESLDQIKDMPGFNLLVKTKMGSQELSDYIADEKNDVYLAFHDGPLLSKRGEALGKTSISTDPKKHFDPETGFNSEKMGKDERHQEQWEVFDGILPDMDLESVSFVLINEDLGEDGEKRSLEEDFGVARVIFHEFRAHITAKRKGVPGNLHHDIYGEEHNTDPTNPNNWPEGGDAMKFYLQVVREYEKEVEKTKAKTNEKPKNE